MEKRKVKVTADSTCDLSPELIAKYDISIIPLYVFLGEDSFRDGVDLTNEGIFSYCDQSKGLAHTAALNHLDYLNFFKPFIDVINQRNLNFVWKIEDNLIATFTGYFKAVNFKINVC